MVAAGRVVPWGLGDPTGLEASDPDRSLALLGEPGHHEPTSVLGRETSRSWKGADLRRAGLEDWS